MTGDNVVNNLDVSIVENSHTAVVTGSSAFYDLNCSGAVDASDDALVTAAAGTSIGAQTDTNLAIFQPPTALSYNGGNTPAMAFDSSLGTRWEKPAAGRSRVDLRGPGDGLHHPFGVAVLGDRRRQELHHRREQRRQHLDLPGDRHRQHVTNQYLKYPVNVTGRYVRMYGTVRTSGTGTNGYGYSLYDFQVIGLSGSNTPVINSATSATATTGSAFSYQIGATGSPTATTRPGCRRCWACPPRPG